MLEKRIFINGVMDFVENEMLPPLEGWQYWVGAGALYLAREKAEGFLDPFLSNKASAALGLVTEDGLIDVDKAYNALKRQGDKLKPIYLNLGIFGDFTVTSKDLDKLYGQLRKLPKAIPPPKDTDTDE